MSEPERNFKMGLLGLSVIHLLYFCFSKYGEVLGISGVLYPNGTPVGGDFINLWTVAKLILSDRIADIYRVHQFMAYQDTITGGANIGLRLWAYPPHSLLLVWPFGFLGYYAALVAWSVLGLSVLFAGARRFGFDRLETTIILISPATVLNLYSGQSGSFATGMLLLALSARSGRDPISIGAAVLLTIKPQTGFLLPILWIFQKRWRMIVSTVCGMGILIVMAYLQFGAISWRDYLGDTLPALSILERRGSGPFMTMIPSMFIAMRIVTDDSTFALVVHAGFAAVVAAVLVWRLWRIENDERRSTMVLIATVLMTPYMHNYDLALLFCAALLVARCRQSIEKGRLGVELLVLTAWFLPQLVVILNTVGVPISPLLILPLLFLA